MHFMGLCSKDSLVAAKEEIVEEDPKVPGVTYEQDDKPSTVSNVPAQLTIFYAGTVGVFDDISPEKAQAIMILAGNGVILSKMAQGKLDMKSSISRLPYKDGAINQSMNVPPCSCHPSPISVSSHPIDQITANNDDANVPNTFGTLFNNMEDPSRIVFTLGSIAASAMLSSAVPQARKASLARFFEKRKERVMSAAPYNLSKKTSDSGAGSSCVTSEIFVPHLSIVNL